jgi:hypothetical protein
LASSIDSITNLVKPINLADIQILTGFARIVCEYTPAINTLLEPSQKFSKSNVVEIEKFWNNEKDRKLNVLKEILTTKPVLLMINAFRSFRLEIDTSRLRKAIVAVLLQVNDRGYYQPVAYWSWYQSGIESSYSITELEFTALHNSIIHWQEYLMKSIEFEVFMDYSALANLMKMERDGRKESQKRLYQLCLELRPFTFKITHNSSKVSHFDVEAVSKLLGKDESKHVLKVEELFDENTETFLSSELQYLTTEHNGMKDVEIRKIN